jgi:hypothetical protein
LPTRSGVPEPGATVQGRDGPTAQGCGRPSGRRGRRRAAQPSLSCAMRTWLPKGSRRPKSMP